MNRDETVREFAKFSGRSIASSYDIMRDLENFITQVIIQQETVRIYRLLSFGVKKQKGGKVIDVPGSGRMITQDHMVPYIKFSKKLSELIRHDKEKIKEPDF